ncbi:MAG: molybdate ABC transporter permease subunit [Bacteroidota bacterium]|nr:molybdate ABC transporter permease subunit [Bacteroidota bacterium]
MDPAPIFLTLKLAFFTTLILLAIAVPFSMWLLQKRTLWKAALQVGVSLPLVLPPTVIGFYLLVAFSPAHAFGNFLETHFGLRLVFSFGGILLGSVIYSLPFMMHPILSGLSSLPPSLREASYSLGKSKWQTLFRVLLPNIKPSLLTGIVLTFAHTIGEFGVVLMIGGNIPGRTNVASIALYDQVEALQYGSANQYALVLVLISLVTLFFLYFSNRKSHPVDIL